MTYLGPFLLTGLLLDCLKAGSPARIINVASDLHRQGRLNFDDLQSERKYSFLASYAQAELAKILYTYELSRRLQNDNITVNCLHPGGVRTGMFRNFRGPLRWLLWMSDGLKKSPAAGARTSLYLATDNDAENVTGGYFMNCHQVRSSSASYDRGMAQQIWAAAEVLTGGPRPG